MRLPILVCVATFGAVLAFPTAAHAEGHHEYVRRGQPCSTIGEEGKNRNGVKYVCDQRDGDPCPVFHAANPRKGPWVQRPTPECPECSKPVADKPADVPAKPAEAAPVAPPKTVVPPVKPVADELPTTGPPVWLLAAVGLALLAAGFGLIRVGGRA